MLPLVEAGSPRISQDPMPSTHISKARSAFSSFRDFGLSNRSPTSRYLLAVLGMLMATGVSLVVRPWFGNHSAVTIAYLVATLASAWWGGYGPGLVACTIGLWGAPYIFTPNFDLWRTDVIRDLLVFLVSILVSRVSERQRRLENTLRQTNNTLELSVQERTKELQQANFELEKANEALQEFA